MKYLTYIIFVSLLILGSCSKKIYISEKENKVLFGSYYVVKKDDINKGSFSIIKYSVFFGNSKKKGSLFVDNDGSIVVYPKKRNGWIIKYDKEGNKSKTRIRHKRIDLHSPSW